LEENLSIFDVELRRLVAYEAISIGLLENGRLLPAYAAGEEFRPETSLDSVRGNGNHPGLNCPVGERGIALVVPLQYAGAVMGVVALYRSGAIPFSHADLELLHTAAAKLAHAPENARKYRDLVSIAGIDLDTGLLNGRALFLRLDAELARARRSDGRLAVFEMAIKGLEGPPEVISHALERVGEGIRRCCREYDFGARTGDHLVLVLVGFNGAEVNQMEARIGAILDDAARETGLPFSTAMGAAFFPTDGSDTEDLLAAVATRLQISKCTGAGRGLVPA